MTTTSPITLAVDDTAAPPQALLTARGVRKIYRSGAVEVTALRDVDLDVAPGEFLTIMGPSGHGKTTLLNCVSGLDQVDAGTVVIDGHDIHRLSDAARTTHRARRMGFIFQSFNLIPVLSAVENVELPLLAVGERSRAARRKATDMLERVGLGGRAAHRPAELSGGEQQRVATARALVTEPALVWADEPTGNLDSGTAAMILDLLRDVNANGQALVVVTHDDEVGHAGHRLVRIEDGRVAHDEVLR